MRKRTLTVLDEYLAPGTDAARPALTSVELATQMGSFDQFAVQLIVTNPTSAAVGGAIDLYFEHSADGRYFVPVKPLADPSQPGGGDVKITNLKNNANVAWGSYNGAEPLLGLLRFRVFFSGPNANAIPNMGAHVRVLITQRDQG